MSFDYVLSAGMARQRRQSQMIEVLQL